MKKTRLFIIVTLLSAMLCGCSGTKNAVSDISVGTSDESETGGGNLTSSAEDNTEEYADIEYEDFVGEYPDNPIDILSLSRDEVVRLINGQDNFVCGDNLYIDAPERCSVYDFKVYYSYVPTLDYSAEQYREDFYKAMEYLFPGRKLSPDYLTYETLWDEDGNHETGYVKDRDELPKGVSFKYNETPERPAKWENPIYAEFSTTLSGGGAIDRGETVHLIGKKDLDSAQNPISSDTYNRLGWTLFEEFLTYVGTYQPTSEKSFNLLDGECKICDAVKFYENYADNIPISSVLPRNISNHVYSVDVYKINNDVYGFMFDIAPRFQGVDYSTGVSGSTKGNAVYSGMSGDAMMIKSDEVDRIQQYFGNFWTFDVVAHDSVVPLETALEIVSKKLTKNVTFRINKVEFCCGQDFVRGSDGYIKSDKLTAVLTPVWQIYAYNPNDDRTYVCYVDAAADKAFSYVSVSGELSFEQ